MVTDRTLAAPSPGSDYRLPRSVAPSYLGLRLARGKIIGLSFSAATSARFLLSSIKGALLGSVLTAQFMELDPFLLALKKKYPAPDIQTHRDRSSWAILWSPRPPMRKIYT